MKRRALLVLAVLGTAGFLALGVWQLERREWKLALIARVEQRVHAAPVAAPGPAQWAALTRESAEYRRVTATGHFLEGRETLVRAVTALGGGFWVMAPFQTDEGFTVLVNRGFVSPGWREASPNVGTHEFVPVARTGVSPVTIVGLMRMTEPKGGFLRANAPDQNRWYSRDVDAIAHAQHLSGTAPYFIDVEQAAGAGPANATATSPEVRPMGVTATSNAAREPVGGLTVVTFRNSHLTYAITWFALALMVAAFGARLMRLPR
jgi:surfeit locus 1 family protein